MAKDMKGNFHRAGFQARKADRMPPTAASSEEHKEGGEQAEPAEGEGDHMHAAAQSMHDAEPGSKHMVMSHDGYGLKTHSIDEAGQHDGPHEDEDAEAHLQRFKGEGGGEKPMPEMQDEQPMHAGGLY